MCGIAGVVDRQGGGQLAAVARMLAAMEHRGPDGSGTFAEGSVALGNRRLAIFDPSPAGAQPMIDATERYVCTYNGAIYNYVELRQLLKSRGHSFRSTCDTEVLLAAFAEWGTECLGRLNGMFAFALYDRDRRVLFCARDRLGVKPFVYTSNGRWFAFASEHKALIGAGLATNQVSRPGVYEFIARGYVTSGRSLYEDMRTLPPGCALTIGPDGRERITEWWSPGRNPVPEGSPAEWPEAVREVLEDAARLRLRSDVPLGAHLSGGLDSSSVVAAAARAGGRDFTAFTGAFVGVPEADERPYSRALTDALGVSRVEIELDVGGLSRVFHRVLWHLDEPVAGPGVLPQQLVYDATAAKGVKVVLAGQGGDELFGGYLRHRGLYFKNLLLYARNPVHRARAGLELFRLILPEWRRVGRTSVRVHDANLAPGFVASVDRDLREEVRRRPLDFPTPKELMLWDLRNYLPALLHADDRISMSASVETRAPLLDYRLVELATSIPDVHHFRRRVSKPLLRGAVEPWLPPLVAHRRDKRGFPTPLELWNRHPEMRRLVEELLGPGTRLARKDGNEVFAPEYLARPGAMKPSELWTVMLLQGWLRSLERGSGWCRPGVSTGSPADVP